MIHKLCNTITILLLTASITGIAKIAEAETLILSNGEQLDGSAKGVLDGRLMWLMLSGEQKEIPFDAIQQIDYSATDESNEVEQADLVIDTTESKKEAADSPEDKKVDNAVVTADGIQDVDDKVDLTIYEHMEEVWHNTCDNVCHWTKRVELGARFLDGNSNDDFINIGMLFEHRAGRRFTEIDGNGQWGRSEGIKNTNRWNLNSTTDFDKDAEGKWIYFVSTKNRYDEFENLDYRGTLSGGLGYRFYNEPERRLIVRVGPAVTYEIFNNPRVTRTTADIFAELEIRWPVSDRAHFENKTTIFPSVDSLDVFRLTMDTGLLIKIDEAEKWLLKLGLLYNYNSQPNMGRQKADYTTSVSLVYSRD